MTLNAQTGFTESQKQIIEGENTAIMRLYTTDNAQDSAFLKQPSAVITKEMAKSKYYKTLRSRMLATVLDESNPGVGIAAPQTGIAVRLVAVQRLDREGEPFEFYVNPTIDAYSEEQSVGREGCLSVPGKNAEVVRSEAIVVSYDDPKTFKRRSEEIHGFTAVIFQHEIDHLDGILYPDRAQMQTKTIDFTPSGVCSKRIEISVQGDIVTGVRFTGGCRGNSQGIAALVRGMKVNDVITTLEGITCGERKTSCPDQLTKALKSVQ